MDLQTTGVVSCGSHLGAKHTSHRIVAFISRSAERGEVVLAAQSRRLCAHRLVVQPLLDAPSALLEERITQWALEHDVPISLGQSAVTGREAHIDTRRAYDGKVSLEARSQSERPISRSELARRIERDHLSMRVHAGVGAACPANFGSAGIDCRYSVLELAGDGTRVTLASKATERSARVRDGQQDAVAPTCVAQSATLASFVRRAAVGLDLSGLRDALCGGLYVRTCVLVTGDCSVITYVVE